jgi:hypothetical protein
LTDDDKARIIRNILGAHKDYWQEQQSMMRKLHDSYLTQFYRSVTLNDETSIRVETSDAYVFVESFIASLFEKNPSVEVDSLKTTKEVADICRSACNSFLSENRTALENASRLALIYPMSFLKIAPRISADPLARVSIRAVEPWNIILDREADLWADQRFVGHHYYLPMKEARNLYGPKKYSPVAKPSYFDTKEIGKNDALPDDLLFIEIVEFYDLDEDKLYIFSPNYKATGGFLSKEKIPLRAYDDTPMVPIAPLYYSRDPSKPMDGYSALSRVYDQIFEKNILRTFWANAVRRDSRQYLYREGTIDEESLAKLSSGQDGLMIPIDNESLDGIIRAIPVEPLSSNFERYQSAVEADIQRGSIITPNARGEATKATATEITALSFYTSSEIGRMARERDEAIETLAAIYIRMLVYTLLPEEKPVILVGKKARYITADSIDHKFRYFALDQASTPLSKEMKKRQLLELLPVLGQLGVPQDKILEDIVRAFELNESYLEKAVIDEGSLSKAGSAEILEDGPTSSAEVLAEELVSSQRSIPLPVPG